MLTGVWIGDARGSDGEDLDALVPMWGHGPEHAAKLLREVRAAIPEGPMEIDSTMRAKRRGDRPEQRLGARMRIQSGPEGFLAVYMLWDGLGRLTDELTVARDADGQTAYAYRQGDPPREAEMPDLAGTIHDTDLTWVDLSLAYLWWPHGNTVGRDRIRGRFCYVIELPVPEDLGSEAKSVRIWVDPELPMLLRAEEFDEDGAVQRRMSVESFRKMDDVWFIQDIEGISYPERSKTTLRVESVNAGQRGEGPALESTPY